MNMCLYSIILDWINYVQRGWCEWNGNKWNVTELKWNDLNENILNQIGFNRNQWNQIELNWSNSNAQKLRWMDLT